MAWPAGSCRGYGSSPPPPWARGGAHAGGGGGAPGPSQLTNGELWLHPVSATFHGRDILAPVAAHLARGLDITEVGGQIDLADLVSLPAPTSGVQDAEAEGGGMSVDRFGNVQLSIAASEAGRMGIGL